MTYVRLVCALFVLIEVCASALRAEGAKDEKKAATLDNAIASKTEAALLREQTRHLDSDVARLMRKVIIKAESLDTAGDICLTKDDYGSAVKYFMEAAELYRQTLQGRKMLEKLAAAWRKIDQARILTRARSQPKQRAALREMEANARGHLEAAELGRAIAALENVRDLREGLLPPGPKATLEDAVAARTAMFAVKAHVRDAPNVRTRTLWETVTPLLLGHRSNKAAGGRRSFSDMLSRAVATEQAAAEALEDREYTVARTLFQQAEELYLKAVAPQAQRHKALAAQTSADNAMKLADSAFQTELRPASFERGKVAVTDGNNALKEEDFDAARKHFAQAAENFARAQAEADTINKLVQSQKAWAEALASTDEALLEKYMGAEFDIVKKIASHARQLAAAGKIKEAREAYTEALARFKDVDASALTKQNLPKAEPLLRRLEAAIRDKQKFPAEDMLEQLIALVPKYPRLESLRRRVDAIPGPQKTLTVDLGGGTILTMILIRPGEFVMGEKPGRKVVITEPFYIGKFEVTQAQYEAVIGVNPSRFKDPQGPVDQVSWFEALAFCEKLSEREGREYRLPTEAEWEYACRAGSQTAYCFGDDAGRLAEYAWFADQCTHPVGQKKPNAWGLFDMHGNVYEWCYALEKQADPQKPRTDMGGVLRGGGWISDATSCRAAYRNNIAPDLHDYNVGLRVSCGVEHFLNLPILPD